VRENGDYRGGGADNSGSHPADTKVPANAARNEERPGAELAWILKDWMNEKGLSRGWLSP